MYLVHECVTAINIVYIIIPLLLSLYIFIFNYSLSTKHLIYSINSDILLSFQNFYIQLSAKPSSLEKCIK